MASNEPMGAVFAFELAAGDDDARLVARWSGHIDADGLRSFCAALEQMAGGDDAFALSLDARCVTGYDPEARAVAAAFARGPVAARLASLALVVDSQLVGAESPGLALAQPHRAQLFGSLAAAAAWLGSRSAVRSGAFRVAHVAPLRRCSSA